jgi:MFS family permease
VSFQRIMRQHSLATLPEPEGQITIRPIGTVSFLHIAETMFKYYLQRSLLSFSLMVSQTFLYNAVFFTYSLILTAFYHIPINNVAWYLIPFALGNLAGPLTIGHLFDTIGRRKMISFTYIVPGLLLIFTGWLFVQGYLNAVTQTLCWSLIFFLASAGASSAYLTISEIFLWRRVQWRLLSFMPWAPLWEGPSRLFSSVS